MTCGGQRGLCALTFQALEGPEGALTVPMPHPLALKAEICIVRGLPLLAGARQRRLGPGGWLFRAQRRTA